MGKEIRITRKRTQGDYTLGDDSGNKVGGMQNGPFPGSVSIFNGSAVPVPATIWLLGSGLLGLVGFAHRSKQLYRYLILLLLYRKLY